MLALVKVLKSIFIFLPEISIVETNTPLGTADRHKVIIIVGANMGILLIAGMIGMMCYNKRTYQGTYHKVPGIMKFLIFSKMVRIFNEGEVEKENYFQAYLLSCK